jgi:hypothetical protein
MGQATPAIQHKTDVHFIGIWAARLILSLTIEVSCTSWMLVCAPDLDNLFYTRKAVM